MAAFGAYRFKAFHSILRIPVDPDIPIKTFHLSFRDFLLDPGQKSRNPFSVEETEVHRRIAGECIALLSEKLRAGICSLGPPGILKSDIGLGIIQQSVPADVGYAYQYWVHHLKKSQHDIEDDGPVHKFLQEHLLDWLEATSILGISSNNIHLVKDLQSIIPVYFSALLFSPENGIAKTTFSPSYPNWQLGITRGILTEGKQLASVLADKTVKPWDVESGVLVQTFDRLIFHVHFSKAGRALETDNGHIYLQIIGTDFTDPISLQNFGYLHKGGWLLSSSVGTTRELQQQRRFDPLSPRFSRELPQKPSLFSSPSRNIRWACGVRD
ncbi:hypothetical protein TWF481_003015 [Arthrobotrys musiformis]|uniref:Uncharacterized protein n=1 Tax=Arthrobotrys musiformis TaxID=47236 RepID=A0AAV9VY10_9PEZI